MKKLKLFMAAFALLLGWSNAMAQGTWNAPEIPGSDISTTNTGNYAIYNVKADAFMGEGMNYGTEALACRLENGYSGSLAARQKFTLTVSNGTVKMVHANHTDKGVGCASANANDIYADYGSNNAWTFASSNTAPDYGNVYNLSLAGFGTLDVDDKWGGKLTTTGGPGNTDWAFIPEGSLTDGSFAKWVERKAMYDIYLALVASSSISTYASELATANAVYTNGSATVSDLRAATRALILATAAGIQQSTNVSALFTNANMQQDGTSDWTNDNPPRSGGAIERWHGTFTLTQSKTDIPNGMYTLVFRGMTRQDGSGAAPIFSATTSGDVSNNANIPWMTDIASRWNVRGDNNDWAGSDGSKIPDRLWRAAEGLAYDEATATISNFKVTGNALTLTVTQNRNDQWFTYNSFDIIYNGPTNLVLYNQVLAAKATAEAIDDAKTTDAVQTALDDAISGTAGLSALSEEDDLNDALDALNTAIGYYEATKDSYASFNALKASANGIAAIEYTETTSGSHSTFASAISTQTTAVEGATAAGTINTAISTLKTAVKTYINSAEPKNDGESFEITCLITNPKFADNTITGWTRTDVSAGGNAQTNYGCNEFWNNTFNFYQDLVELPNGSYQLSVQAFCRPGGNDVAYPAYKSGTDNTTAELYVNSDASRVGNIYSYKGNTTGAKVSTGGFADYKCVVDGGTDYWVPNGMEGASLYFADANVYKTEVAALVDDNTLRIGFRDESLTANQWTIFSNFRLYYYGSSKLVYYKQYLPQLKAEVTDDLANAAYDNVTGKERGDLQTAKAATPASETEGAYKDVIDDIKDKQTAFKTAKSSYDGLATAKASSLTKITSNIGTGIFQYDETTNNTLYSAYETQKAAVDAYTVTSSTTASAVKTIVDAYDDAVDDYINQPLNAPDADKHYNIVVATAEHAKTGNAIVMDRAAEYPVYQGSYISNNTGFTLNASATPNANLAQACVFTPVDGKANTYYIAMERTEGTVYLTYGSLNDSKVNWKGDQIQATTESSKKGEFKIAATTTANQFNILNTVNGNPDNEKIACQTNGNIYTENKAENAYDFSIAEASQATVDINIDSDVQYATRIFPFTPTTWPNGVVAYSCEETEGNVLSLVEVAEPVANVPYILYAEGGSTGSVSGWGTAPSTDVKKVGMLNGVYEETTATAGTYVLQKNNGKVGFYKVVAEQEPTVGAYRCYLTDGANARAAYFFGGVTGVASVEAATEATLKDGKYLENGKIVIVKAGKKFNATGAQMK